MDEWHEPDWVVDSDDDPYSQAEFRVEAGRVVMDVGYDCNCAHTTYVVDAAQLRRLCEAALEREVAEMPRSGRMIAQLNLPSIEWHTTDASFDEAVRLFLWNNSNPPPPAPWSSAPDTPAAGERKLRQADEGEEPDDGTCRGCYEWRRYGLGQEHFGWNWWRTCPPDCSHPHHEAETWMASDG